MSVSIELSLTQHWWWLCHLVGVFNPEVDDGVSLKARKFNHGKEAKKAAAAMQLQRDAEYEAYLQSEEGQKTQAILDEHRQKRGPSLMDAHLEKQAKKKPKANEPRRAFDRELVSK